MKAPVIVWFRSDLRVADNRALRSAAATGAPVVALFILDEAAAGRWQPGAASRWWLHYSLASLHEELEALGGSLLLRRGNTVTELQSVAESTGATAVYWNRVYEPWARQLDADVADELGAQLELEQSAGNLLFEPGHILNQQEQPFRVFTPFYKRCLLEPEPAKPLPTPRQLTFARTDTGKSAALESWRLLPTQPDWAAAFATEWRPGAAGAEESLERFIAETAAVYKADRNRPDRPGTSRLSPHLHCGEISVNQVWHALKSAMAEDARDQSGGEAFLREIVWREFSYHLLHHWPDLPSQPFRKNFAAFPWQQDAGLLRAWQKGQTGYPFVDAGMRELWHTGWMHNRVRMVAASFLVKHLLIPWQEGEAWFWDTLVDADLANNAASWQWVAGCGADAAPYFRIFNPVIQGQKFDPAGSYVRKWVPELATVPDKHIHSPWRMGADAAAAAGIQLGIDYPLPIVDHAAARADALAAFATIRQS